MRKPRNIDELIHAWAHQHHEAAQCGSVRFDGNRLYSYAECIAMLLPNNAVVFTTRTWSMTTSSHLSAARRATSHMKAVWAYGPHWSPRENRNLVERNIAHMAGQMPDPVLKKDGTESELSKKRRAQATAEIMRTVQNFNEYLAATGDTTVQPIPEPDIEDMKQAMQDLARLEEERRREEVKKRDREAAETLKKWRNHETHVTSVSTSKPALRLSQDGNWVETSWGARIPTLDAEKLWPRILKCKESAFHFTTGNSPMKLGPYGLNEIKADGSIVVGCHKIDYGEIEYIAILLGFITLKEPKNG